MASGLGFKGTAPQAGARLPRKKMVAPALLITFGVLVIAGGIYGGLLLWHNALQKNVGKLSTEINNVNADIQAMVEGAAGDFGVRATTMQKDLYKDYETNDILREIERIMIKKSSDGSGNRVVLKSFQYNAGAYDKQAFGNTTRTVTGKGNVTISADADSFDVMAQQVEEFKKSDLFDAVKVGTTDRDDTGRIIFTLTMDVNRNDKTPYEKTAVTSDAVFGVPMDGGTEGADAGATGEGFGL